MLFFRCRICGDVYMGGGKPTNCPYCGAKAGYLLPVEEWTDENETVGAISEVSLANLKKALQLEVNNAPFYRDASAKAATIRFQGIFKGLGKVEAEHASALKKLLKCEFPPPEPEGSRAADGDTENLKLALEREVFAAKFYRQASSEAVEPRVKVVFTALTEIETDHIILEKELLGGK